MVTLIHNVLTTDYVALIHDDDCVMGLELLERRRSLVERLLGRPRGYLDSLEGVFGISGICNILGAIRMARHLDLGPEDNVVTIATDGFDRYPSVLANLEKRRGPLDDASLSASFEADFPRRRRARDSGRAPARNRRSGCSATRSRSGALSATPIPIWRA